MRYIESQRDEYVSREERGRKGREEFKVCLIKIISDTILRSKEFHFHFVEIQIFTYIHLI